MPLAMTGYEIGLLASALAFMAFALVVALVIPRSRPEFPSPHLGWFIGVCIVFFAVQMTAVILLAEVGEAHAEAAGHESTPGETEPAPTEPTPTVTTPTETTETETEPPETPTGTTPTETTETETTETQEVSGDPVAGKEVFASAACGGCHTLADAGANATIGPDLDASSPSYDLVVERVTNGQGAMPPFADSLTAQQIQDVAAYVSSATS